MRRVLVGAVVIGLGVAGLTACSDDSSTTPSSTSAPTTSVTTAALPSSSTASSSTASSSTAPASTAPASTTTVLTPPTTPPSAPTTAGSPPVAVAEVRAGPGGGSGEITVTWRGVLGAASYRVERATTPDGPFTSGGTITPDGRVTRGDGVVNLFAAGDGTFTYVEVIATLSNGGVQRWYRVAATNAAGATGLSRVVCGAPPGAPAC